jgi:tetratricopeptide (TPR) repeat protein
VAERLFGLETEYALSALGRRGERVDPGMGLHALVEHVRRRVPHLPGRFSGGMFLQTGGRFYIDSGGHPELTTPEVTNPWDACRYVLAGDRLLGEAAEEMVGRERAVAEVVLTRCNVCYEAARPTTWGCHESYGHRGDPAAFADEILPHLVSRIVYAGAGGFNNRSAAVEFLISPRAVHLTQAQSDSSTHQRGIFHTKNEPLAGNGYHRLHLLCGESLCSHTSMWLRTAVTALVVAMIEAGLQPCRDVALRHPVQAMLAFSRDVNLTAAAPARAGGQLTAVGIQRHILGKLEEHAGHPVMPSWAAEVRRRLAEVLDRLEREPAAVARTLDWSIKLALYREYARRRGFAWETIIEGWNPVLSRLGAALRRLTPLESPTPPLRAAMLPGTGLLGEEAAAIEPHLARHGLGWDRLDEVLRLRAALFELDTRFAQVGPKGIFNVLDRSGALEHAVPGVDNVEHAAANPPASGRANLRGRLVQRLAAQGGERYCDWSGVWDVGARRFLDLSDPFAAEERWCDHREHAPSVSGRMADMARDAVARANRLYQEGRYDRARYHLDHVRPLHDCLDWSARIECLRLSAWVQSRRGMVDGTESLDVLAAGHMPSLWLITDYVSNYRFRGLAPDPRIVPWIERGEAFLRDNPGEDRQRVAAFREHQGTYLMYAGRLEESRAALQEAQTLLATSPQNRRVLCRAVATLGEVLRRLGDDRAARNLLQQALETQTALGCLGDLADFTLTYQAKLAEDRPAALAAVQRAKQIQLELGNRMGETRSMLVEARLGVDRRDAIALREKIDDYRRSVPALGGCRLLGRVLEHWDAWIQGRAEPGGSGERFWGV